MRDPVFQIGFGHGAEAVPRIEGGEMRLRRQSLRVVRRNAPGLGKGRAHQVVAKAGTAPGRGNDDAADAQRFARSLRPQQAQAGGKLRVAFTALARRAHQQVAGLRIAAIDLRIGAGLLDDEDVDPQAQQIMELARGELIHLRPECGEERPAGNRRRRGHVERGTAGHGCAHAPGPCAPLPTRRPICSTCASSRSSASPVRSCVSRRSFRLEAISAISLASGVSAGASPRP